MKILVCEDEDVALKVIQVALEKENYDITYVRDGDKALRLLKAKNTFDLIITDVHMPHHNGDEIFNLVRQELKQNTPFIMMSSDDAPEAITLAKKTGVNEYLVKPVDPKALNKIVKRVLGV
jgi:DNA-binding response OmpR family regulator